MFYAAFKSEELQAKVDPCLSLRCSALTDPVQLRSHDADLTTSL